MTREGLPALIAAVIHEGFDVFYGEFKRLTHECRQWFDDRDWVRVHDLSQQRIDLYQQFVGRTLTALAGVKDASTPDVAMWRDAHKCYAVIVQDRSDVEVAETFFNAITRKIFRTVGVNREVEFLEPDLHVQHTEVLPGLARRIPWTGNLVDVFVQALSTPRPALVWRDIEDDARWLADQFVAHCQGVGVEPEFAEIEVIRALFFRVREGYIVARVRRAESWSPWVVPIAPMPHKVAVDGLLLSENSLLQVFSATRSYFFVDVHKPYDLVRFLGSLMPHLTQSELYISIAHHRHGKTLIYRELVDHMRSSADSFVMAPGIPGLVMTVFTLPSYRNVFKVIRDRFDKPTATREAILQSYRDVFRGSRVGRLADTQEFEYLAFERDRFTPECLQRLLELAGGSIDVDGDSVVVRHLYIEEKMTPLNLYMVQADESAAERAIVDYGYAIKELAANNIFAGDLLWKNFGVTRSGRLVLYDYDEICPLLECRFRRIPAPTTYEEELSDQPYYAVADGDVFPEEWLPFIAPRHNEKLRKAFLAHHGDLFNPEFWRDKQRQVVEGELQIGLPYTLRRRRWIPGSQAGS